MAKTPTVFRNPGEWLASEGYKSWQFKYVRFADGVVLFCDACSFFVTHQNIVGDHPGVPVHSAGKIHINGDRWKLGTPGSMTLKVGSSPSDKKYIQRALEPLGFTYDETIRGCD